MQGWATYSTRFILGGTVVTFVSLIAAHAPRVSGIVAGFPAVFVTALIILRIFSGPMAVMPFAQTALRGMVGSMMTFGIVFIGLHLGWSWPFSLIMGFAGYLAYIVVMVQHTRKSLV